MSIKNIYLGLQLKVIHLFYVLTFHTIIYFLKNKIVHFVLWEVQRYKAIIGCDIQIGCFTKEKCYYCQS